MKLKDLKDIQFFQPKITFEKLKDRSDCLVQCATWGQEEWGYIRVESTLEERIEIFEKYINNDKSPTPHVMLYNEQVIGMYVLAKADADPKAAELMYVYIDKTFRGYGFGSKLIQSAMNEARALGKRRLLFDTLKENLNKFYQKLGADVMGEGYFIHEPATKLQFNLNYEYVSDEEANDSDVEHDFEEADEVKLLSGRRYSCPSL